MSSTLPWLWVGSSGNISAKNLSGLVSEFCIKEYHIYHPTVVSNPASTCWELWIWVCYSHQTHDKTSDDPISSNYPLTQVADGVISLLGVEHLFVDVWWANAVTEHITSDHDILFLWWCPTDHYGVGQRPDSQRRRLAWYSCLCREVKVFNAGVCWQYEGHMCAFMFTYLLIYACIIVNVLS